MMFKIEFSCFVVSLLSHFASVIYILTKLFYLQIYALKFPACLFQDSSCTTQISVQSDAF